MEERSQMATLCYIEQDNRFLMLHRIKKKEDINAGKWIGIGGHFEGQESPEDCLIREVKEETGLELKHFKFRGLITFVYGADLVEFMCLYTADEFEGNLGVCNEGVLEWVEKDRLLDLTLWEGDKIFLKYLLEDRPFFSMKLVYSESEELLQIVVDGKELQYEKE